MKALTICQPFAHLIMLHEGHSGHKRIENRSWPTKHRGPLLIHAGKSRSWLQLNDDKTRDVEYNLAVGHMAFGAILGVVDVVDCFHIDDVGVAWLRWPWLAHHRHIEGPYCWVLQNVHAFDVPVPFTGKQGLFYVPNDVVPEVRKEQRKSRMVKIAEKKRATSTKQS